MSERCEHEYTDDGYVRLNDLIYSVVGCKKCQFKFLKNGKEVQ